MEGQEAPETQGGLMLCLEGIQESGLKDTIDQTIWEEIEGRIYQLFSPMETKARGFNQNFYKDLEPVRLLQFVVSITLVYKLLNVCLG